MKFRAFIFEDDEACRLYLSTILEARGYEVLSFSEPAECPLYLGRECTCPEGASCGDFLLTDNRMPRMTGLDLIELQKVRGCKGPAARKAICSATFTPEEIERAEKLGCKVFLKPFSASGISAWLDEQEKQIASDRKLIPSTEAV